MSYPHCENFLATWGWWPQCVVLCWCWSVLAQSIVLVVGCVSPLSSSGWQWWSVSSLSRSSLQLSARAEFGWRISPLPTLPNIPHTTLPAGSIIVWSGLISGLCDWLVWWSGDWHNFKNCSQGATQPLSAGLSGLTQISCVLEGFITTFH